MIRCLPCHSGMRAGFIQKKEKQLAVFDFQLQWLTAVHAASLRLPPCSHDFAVEVPP